MKIKYLAQFRKTPKRPLVSPGFAGWRQRTGETGCPRLRSVLLKKEPAIGDGSQFGRKHRQVKSIRGSVVCRNSHIRREMRSSRAFALWVGEKRLRPATRPIRDAGTSIKPQIT
jgi:hypothetical protein